MRQQKLSKEHAVQKERIRRMIKKSELGGLEWSKREYEKRMTEVPDITEKAARALAILRREDRITSASFFADQMWPDSPAHHISYNQGAHGSCKGKGIWLSAGSYLGKLQKRKLVRWDRTEYAMGYEITSLGLKALEKWENANPNKKPLEEKENV